MHLGGVNVCFGPNGSGKSTLLDVLLFLKDLAERGVSQSLFFRGGRLSVASKGADIRDELEFSIQIHVEDWAYIIHVSSVFRELDTYLSELFVESVDGIGSTLFQRHGGLKVGTSAEVSWDDTGNIDVNKFREVRLADPEKLSLATVAVQQGAPQVVVQCNHLVRNIRHLSSRSIQFVDLRQNGSSLDGITTYLTSTASNIWAVLRRLNDISAADERFNVIRRFMSVAFPKFAGLTFNQTSPLHVTAMFLEKGLREPLPLSATPDGYIQLLVVLTALFCEEQAEQVTLLLDEPDLSLHPWAITVLADAIKEATSKWNRQVIIATHSPTLLSEFKEDEILLMQSGENGVTATRVSEIEEDRDLLDRYDLGSLYQMNVIGKQGDKPLYDEVDAAE